MKKTLLGLLLTLALTSTLSAAVTRFPSGVAAGTTPTTYTALTPVANAYLPLSLGSVRLADAYTMPAATSIATNVYFGPVTGLTNTAGAITVPRVDDMAFYVPMIVPQNYQGGGVLEALVHYSAVSDGADVVTMRADVYANTPGSATVTTKAAGTAVNPSVDAGTQLVWVTLTNTNATYVPGASVSFRVEVDGVTVRLEVVALRFKYRPYGVMNGAFLRSNEWRTLALWDKRGRV